MRPPSTPLQALAALTVLLLVVAGCGDDDGPSVALVQPAEGSTAAGGLAVEMEADGITIEAADEARDGAGHFHVIADAGCVPAGQGIPRDADHVHFGKGQTEGTIYLEPGAHELCLQAGDGNHAALDATDRATVTVGITSRDQWCDVVGEIDELFTATDNSDDDFPTKQASYENVRRLLTQAIDGLAQVDADARDGVRAGLEFAETIVTTFVEAEDMAGAEQALEPVFAGGETAIAGAQPWILDTCGVDIDT